MANSEIDDMSTADSRNTDKLDRTTFSIAVEKKSTCSSGIATAALLEATTEGCLEARCLAHEVTALRGQMELLKRSHECLHQGLASLTLTTGDEVGEQSVGSTPRVISTSSGFAEEVQSQLVSLSGSLEQLRDELAKERSAREALETQLATFVRRDPRQGPVDDDAVSNVSVATTIIRRPNRPSVENAGSSRPSIGEQSRTRAWTCDPLGQTACSLPREALQASGSKVMLKESSRSLLDSMRSWHESIKDTMLPVRIDDDEQVWHNKQQPDLFNELNEDGDATPPASTSAAPSRGSPSSRGGAFMSLPTEAFDKRLTDVPVPFDKRVSDALGPAPRQLNAGALSLPFTITESMRGDEDAVTVRPATFRPAPKKETRGNRPGRPKPDSRFLLQDTLSSSNPEAYKDL